MEARPSCRARLQVIGGGAHTHPVKDEPDEDRERRSIAKVGAALKQALEELPSTSSWRLPFLKAWRAIRDELGRRRRNE